MWYCYLTALDSCLRLSFHSWIMCQFYADLWFSNQSFLVPRTAFESKTVGSTTPKTLWPLKFRLGDMAEKRIMI